MDHYRVLQVTREADPIVIERAYKALSLKYHPDTTEPARREQATRHMQELNEAYRVLRDPELRRRYDRKLMPETASAWDQFWEKGLLGLFNDRFRLGSRR